MNDLPEFLWFINFGEHPTPYPIWYDRRTDQLLIVRLMYQHDASGQRCYVVEGENSVSTITYPDEAAFQAERDSVYVYVGALG